MEYKILQSNPNLTKIKGKITGSQCVRWQCAELPERTQIRLEESPQGSVPT